MSTDTLQDARDSVLNKTVKESTGKKAKQWKKHQRKEAKRREEKQIKENRTPRPSSPPCNLWDYTSLWNRAVLS